MTLKLVKTQSMHRCTTCNKAIPATEGKLGQKVWSTGFDWYCSYICYNSAEAERQLEREYDPDDPDHERP